MTEIVLRKWQAEALPIAVDAVRAGKAPVIAAFMGCHAKGQRIIKADGNTVAVEDVRVGDVLLGPDSTPRTVLYLARGSAEMFDIVPIKGRPWRVNGDHVLSLVDTRDGADAPIQDMTVKQWMGIARTVRDFYKLVRAEAVTFAGGQELPMNPYLLGLILGDGCIKYGGIGITTMDQAIVDAIYSEAARLGYNVRCDAKPNNVASSYHFSHEKGQAGKSDRMRSQLALPGMEASRGVVSRSLHNAIRDLGLDGTGSETKFVPHIYKTAPIEDRVQVLAGLLDTDGSLCKTFDYVSKSEMLAEDVAFLSRSVGLAAYVVPCKKHDQNGRGGTYYRVSISGHLDKIPTRLARKQAGERKQPKNVLRTGFTVRPSGTVEDFYGFALDGDQRYLLADFTITHNSGKSVLAAEFVRRSKERPGYSVIVAAPRLGLVEQLAGTFGRAVGDANVGQWHGGRKQADRRVVVATYQSLAGVAEGLRSVGRKPALLICDEAHRTETEDIIGAVETLRGMTAGGHLARIAITATAYRSAKNEALSLWDEVVYRYPYEAGLRDGVIVPHRVVGWNGVGRPEDVDAVTADMLAENGLFPALADAGSVKDAEAFADFLNVGSGIRAMAIHSRLKKEEQQRRIDMLRSGELKVLVHVSMLAEGSDFPWLRTLALRRNIGARVRFVQQCGRVLRVDPENPEKREGVILDPLDLMGLHGLAHPEALGRVLDEGVDEEGEEGAEKPAKKTAAQKRQELEALEGTPLREWLASTLAGLGVDVPDMLHGRAATDRQIAAIDRMKVFLKWWPHAPTKDRVRAWLKDGRIATVTVGEASGLLGWLRALADVSVDSREAIANGEYFRAPNLLAWPAGWTCPEDVPRLDPEGRAW